MKQLIFFIHFFTAPYPVNDIELNDLILSDGLTTPSPIIDCRSAQFLFDFQESVVFGDAFAA